MCKLILTFILFYSPLSWSANFEAKEKKVVDRETQLKLCLGKNVTHYTPAAKQLIEDNCLQKTEFRLTGYTRTTGGKLTIKHYELSQPMWGSCKVQAVLVPKHKYVVTDPAESGSVGEIKEKEESWEYRAVLPKDRGACF